MKGSTYKRKDGRWVGVVDIGKDARGKRRQKYVYGSKEKEVRTKLNKIIAEIENDEFIEPTKNTLVGFLNEYYSIQENRWQQTTAALYRMYIDVHFEPYFQISKLKDLKPIDLDKFYNYKMQDNDNRKKLSINTIYKLHAFLNAALNYAVSNNYIKQNPCNKVDLPKKKKYIPTVYSNDQFLQLVKEVKNTFDEVPILLGAGCGLRRGEVFGLLWSNVDFNNKSITIEQSTVRFNKNITKDPKNETSKRTIHIPDYVLDALLRYKNSLEYNPKPNEKIMGSYRPQSYSERFKNLLEKHGMKHIRFHDLRHFNAVLMMNNGISDKVAAERLGHSNTTTLREIYQHVLTSADKDAASKLNNIFN